MRRLPWATSTGTRPHPKRSSRRPFAASRARAVSARCRSFHIATTEENPSDRASHDRRPRMDPPGIRRHRHGRHHPVRAGAARRHRLRRAAGGGPQAGKGRGRGGDRIGEGRRRVQGAGVGNGDRSERGARRRAGQGELGSDGRGLVLQAQARQSEGPRRAAGRSDLSRKAGKMTQHDAFARRHIGPGEEEQRAMLGALGIASMEELIARAVPAAIRREKPLDLPASRTEAQALAALKEIAAQNKVMRSFIGLGYSGCHTPSVILRNVLENPAWYTAYTPYQPEISQGRLEALINFQTMVSDLTGMDIANASMLDEPTAAAEAMTLAARVTKSKSTRFFVDAQCHPQTLDVVRTRALAAGIEIVTGDAWTDLAASDAFGALLQYPGTLGEVRDLRLPIGVAKKNGTIVAVACDLLALTLLTPPGELGADIAVGSAQRFGVPPCYGGPHAGFFATRDAHKRTMPGRLVGASIDAHGATGYRLALQTREQHIRREKATSNICTAQVLLAVIAGMYAVYHGPEGLAA